MYLTDFCFDEMNYRSTYHPYYIQFHPIIDELWTFCQNVQTDNLVNNSCYTVLDFDVIILIVLELYADKDYSRDDVPTKRLQFNSKEDVTQNLGSLGQRLKVFICYALSVSSKETRGKLESRIYTFARHLITYGFDVRVDLFASFTVGFDWASWTDREMSQADWIIFVNSKSS